MASGVVTVGLQLYATGLYWENSPGSGRVAQIAREAANQPGQQAEFYAVRPGNKNGRIPQFGLSVGGAGQKPSMPVLAGCLANQIPGSWAGAFRLNEGTVVIIVRDDLIVPDGDLFFLDETEARDRLLQEIGFGGLQTTYAPESWSIPGADTIPVALLLSERKDIKLQAVKIPQKLKVMLAAGVLGFIIIAGAIWYWQEKVSQEEAARAQQEEALRLAREAANKMMSGTFSQEPPPPPKYERVWESAPRPMDIVENCYNGLTKVRASAAGWRPASFKCTGTSISLSWVREKGATIPPQDFTVAENGGTATQTITLPPLAARGAEDLPDKDLITKRYMAQNWPGNISVLPDDPPPPPPPDYKGPWNPPPPPWVKRSFTLTVPELPGELPQIMGDLPGFVINGISYTTPSSLNGVWNIEGIIYENRK